MKLRSVLLTTSSICILTSSASAALGLEYDVVLRWNQIAQQAVAPTNPFVQSRSMAMTQLAVLLAATAAGNPMTAGGPASPEAAIMTAAHAVLAALHPDGIPFLDAALAAGLAEITDADAKANGATVGRAAAATILQGREGDGWNVQVAHAPRNVPGAWAPTPPANAPAAFAQWGDITPFILSSGDQFRPGAPAAINSEAYLTDLREIFEIGAASGARRTDELTNTARFWVISAVQGWNDVARQASLAEGRTLLDDALTLAMLNAAIADALIACFDAKYTYDSWRPVTAIQAGAVGDAADWLPLIPSPPFPAYPSAHACAAGAATAVLELSLGDDDHSITLTSATAPGVEFHYTSFEAIADQIDDARLFGGIHTREDQAVGRLLGLRVGQFVYEAMVADGR